MKEITEFVSEMKDENPNITKEKASQLLKEKYDMNKIASQKQSSLHICPKHLLSKEIKGINNLFREQRYYEILTKINELRTECGKDESVIRLISIATFKLLLKDKQYKNLETISFLADNMGRLFFDPVICAYALGTFIMVETSISEKDLENIGLKIIVMHPEKTKKVFHMLPDNVFHGKIKKILDKKI